MKISGSLWFVFLAVSGIFVQGCSELEELRIANRRQAITIRDQMSELDKLKAELDTVKKANDTYQEITQSIGEDNKSTLVRLEGLTRSIGSGAAVRDTSEGPVVMLPEEALFDSGLAKLKPDGEAVLEKIADYLKANPYTSIRIDGHTDDEPINKSKYLWESNHHLSVGRALSVFHYLESKGKIDVKRLNIAGYGPNRPIYSSIDEMEKKHNRRVEILIITSKK